MADWDAFLVVVLPYIMAKNWVPENVKELLAPFWRAVAFFLRYRPEQESHEHIEDAQQCMLQYCTMAEEIFKLRHLATLQLHFAAIHLPQTAKDWGPINFCLEYWVERVMQVRPTSARLLCITLNMHHPVNLSTDLD